MRALTVRQPWATWLIHSIGGRRKDIENRDWRLPVSLIGQRVAIHSSAKEYPTEYYAARDLMMRNGWSKLPLAGAFPRGVILGTVIFTDCVTSSASPFFVGKYGWVATEPRALAEPFPARGALKFWGWDERRYESMRPDRERLGSQGNGGNRHP